MLLWRLVDPKTVFSSLEEGNTKRENTPNARSNEFATVAEMKGGISRDGDGESSGSNVHPDNEKQNRVR